MIEKCRCEKYLDGSLEIHAPQMFCPAFTLWENARRRVRAGENIFPGFTGPGFTEKLGSTAGRYGWEKAGGLEPRGIRRGAARAISDAGASVAQLLRAGQWRSSAYSLFLDLGVEETKAMASILIGASDEGPERRGRRDDEEIP